MKIIDLLIGIANGEEVPNRVRFNNVIWNKVYGEKNIFYKDEYDNDLFIYFFRRNLDFTLNDEVEILEEEKKIPEKIKTLRHSCNFDRHEETLYENQVDLADKYNRLIDYLKSKGE